MSLLGRLTTDAFKHDLIEYGAGVSMLLGGLAIFAFLTYKQKWTWLWKEWITTVDHKKIGVMYIVVSFVMLVKGLIDALMMRAQQAFAVGDCMGYLGADHYQQIFTAHGVTMIFFVGMGLMFGLINLILPLQIGARDVAFPFLNNLSFWLFASSSLYILVSLMVGVFAGTGWTSYPPLTEMRFSPGVGVDYWLWTLQISGAGSLLSGVNFLVTIIKMRCPGMSLMRMPIFVWSCFIMMLLVILSFPVLTATLGMLTTDRLIETRIFSSTHGGNSMMYINMFWAWGHPEVYILILPAFGVFSEIVPVFCKKRLFGYTTMVWALGLIGVLSFIVWLHHFFTMGAGPNVNAFFGIMTMIIAVPTGVKVFNWLFTTYKGRIRFTTPMLWFFAFITTFTIGGMTGVLMSVPPADFQFHNSLFLIAHFHSTIIGGVVFGFFAAYTYWFPKFTGFTLDEKWGKIAFWFWFIGFLVAFLPLYALGLMGVTRRLNHYDVPEWQPLFIVAAIGAVMILIGFTAQLVQLYVSIKQRRRHQDLSGDPWDGRTLEWSTTSPPPFYNFAVTPEVTGIDAFWEQKYGKAPKPSTRYEPIHMPANTAVGFYIGALSFTLGFAMVWYMFALAALSAVGIVACLIYRFFDTHVDYTVSVKDIETIEHAKVKL